MSHLCNWVYCVWGREKIPVDAAHAPRDFKKKCGVKKEKYAKRNNQALATQLTTAQQQQLLRLN